jgi:hypothetical protein
MFGIVRMNCPAVIIEKTNVIFEGKKKLDTRESPF